jgi:ribosomal protein L35
MKRYRFTGTGKVKLPRMGRRHNAFPKGPKRRRQLRKAMLLNKVAAVVAHSQMPYGSR